jgi:hypothetical protein
MSVAYAILQVPRPGRPIEAGVPIERHTTFVVRFPFLPPVGMRVCFENRAWVVADLACELVPGPVAGELVATTQVRLDEIGGGYRPARQAQPGILACVIDEEMTADEAYEGDLIRFPALPRVGEDYYEATHSEEHGSKQVRYLVKAIEHIRSLDRGQNELTVEHVVVIRRASVPGRPSRPPHPSSS